MMMDFGDIGTGRRDTGLGRADSSGRPSRRTAPYPSPSSPVIKHLSWIKIERSIEFALCVRVFRAYGAKNTAQKLPLSMTHPHTTRHQIDFHHNFHQSCDWPARPAEHSEAGAEWPRELRISYPVSHNSSPGRKFNRF